MPLKHGQYITAEQIEYETKFWRGDQFENLCNAIVWSIAPNAQLSSLPNTRDGGVDAEITLEHWDNSKYPLLKQGRNVFQFKKREDKHQWSHIKKDVKGEFESINGKSPISKYILFTNIRLTRMQINQIKESIADGLDPKPVEKIEIVDAGKIEGFLNNNPHIRSAFFVTNQFSTWEVEKENEEKSRLFRINVDFVGRDDEVKQVKDFIEDKETRCVIISGPHLMGKTRLVLEAAKDYQHQVVFALSPEQLGYKDMVSLTQPNYETICIVEDPSLNQVREISSFAFQIDNLKIIITLPTKDESKLSNYGFDDRIRKIELKHFNWESTRRLIHSTKRNVPSHIEDWITNKSGGVPGIILLAISQLDKLMISQTDFNKQIGEGFEEDIRKHFGDESIEVLKRLSLLTYVGAFNQYENEIKIICEVFQDIHLNTILNQIEKLTQTGLVQKKGDFLEVSIPFLANHLAGKLIRGNRDNLFALIARFDSPTSFRLLARLSEIDNSDTQEFWNDLFNTFFDNEEIVFKYSEMLVFLAGTEPEKVMDKLEAILLESSYDKRLNIAGENRRNLMWILEQLLFRKKTSYRALYLIGLLAEAENETFSNNATGTFVGSFHHFHSQLPLSYSERQKLLDEFISIDRPQLTNLVINAISKAFDDHQWWTHKICEGLLPFDERFVPKVLDEVYDYAKTLLKMLWKYVVNEHLCCIEAMKHIPSFLFNTTKIAPILSGISVEYFEKYAELVLTNQYNINISSLERYLNYTIKNLEVNFENTKDEQYKGLINRLIKLKDDIYNSSFEIKVKSVFGGWGNLNDREEDEKEIIALVKLVVEGKENISDSLYEWLLSKDAARGHHFFIALGKVNTELTFWNELLNKLNNDQYANYFIGYYNGIALHDFDLANSIWEERIDKSDISRVIWIHTLMCINPNEERVSKIIGKIHNKEINADQMYYAMTLSHFIRNITSVQLFSILSAIAGADYTNPVSVIRIIHYLIYEKISLSNDIILLCWNCIENLNIVDDIHIKYEIDSVAAHLTKLNYEKGFKVFKTALEKYANEGSRNDIISNKLWKPIDQYLHHKYADTLCDKDIEQFYKIFLELTNKCNMLYIEFEFLMKEYLNLENDFNIIVKLAKEKVEYAKILSNWITSRSPHFYDFINEILPIYPNDDEIKYNLSKGIEQIALVTWGPHHEFLSSLIPEIDKRIEDQNTHIVVREWLYDIKDRLKQQIPKHILWDYNMNIDTFRRHISAKDSELRFWAIGRVLEKGTLKDIQELLTIEDITDTLPHVKLSEDRRIMLERSLQVWQNAI